MKPTHARLLAAASMLAMLGACSTTLEQADPIEEQQAASAAAPASLIPEAPAQQDIEYGNFSRDQLTSIMLSEIGGQRGELQSAARRYRELALESGDIGLIARAAEFAAAAGHAEATVELASLWLEREPWQIEPRLMLGYQLLENQRQIVEAAEYLIEAHSGGGEVEFTAISAVSHTLPAAQRGQLRHSLERLLTEVSNEASLYYAVAQLQEQTGDPGQAEQTLQAAMARFGDSPSARILQAQLLQNDQRGERALEVLAGGVQSFPRDRLLRYNYAQTLIQLGQLDQAREQFSTLTRQRPEDPESLYSLALLNIELEHLEEAAEQFDTLLERGHRSNEARFYLGYLRELDEDIDQALQWYSRVERRSAPFLTSQRQIMRLLVEHGRYEEASARRQHFADEDPRFEPPFATLEAEALTNAGQPERAAQVLNAVLDRHPEDTELLFARTMLNEQLENVPAVESDLRRILTLQPDNARALNHLGYLLTLHTERYEEALQLIERAMELAPEDPAIMDSLGWVQYKLGRHEEAIGNLARAYAALPDDEVAAHLGEVLWITGAEDQAMAVWRDGLSRRPDSHHIRETMERLLP